VSFDSFQLKYTNLEKREDFNLTPLNLKYFKFRTHKVLAMFFRTAYHNHNLCPSVNLIGGSMEIIRQLSVNGTMGMRFGNQLLIIHHTWF
jgi:hypothetical protein